MYICSKTDFYRAFFVLSLLVAMLLLGRRAKKVETSPIEGDVNRSEMAEIVEEINRRNSSVSSVFYGNIRSGRSSSTMFYGKPYNFITITSFLGRKESEVASDKNLFWFWVRSFDAKSAYFCRREDVGVTRMKSAMRPDLLKGLVGIDEIDHEHSTMSMKGGLLEVRLEEFGYAKRIVLDSEKILEQHVSNGDIPVLSVEVVEFHSVMGTFLPKKARVSWHEEGFETMLEMEGLEVNIKKEPQVGIPSGLGLVDLNGY
jgi:hypothetical protein